MTLYPVKDLFDKKVYINVERISFIYDCGGYTGIAVDGTEIKVHKNADEVLSDLRRLIK